MKMNKKGFTLAELLTVVAILAIVVMISIPLISGRIDKAQASTCRTNRQAMMQGTTTISITEKMDWTDAAGITEETIVTYLIDQGYISEAPYCPSGGQIKVSAIHSDTVYFKCTFHDDGIEPGEEESPVILDESAKDLEEAVNRYRETSGFTDYQKHNNDHIIRGFIKSKYTDKMCLVDLSLMLTDKKKEEIAELLVSAGTFDSKEKVIDILNGLVKSEVRLLPYYANAAKTAMTYVTTQNAYEELMAEKGTHKATYFINYKGEWYLYVKKGANGKLSNAWMVEFGTSSLEEVEDFFSGKKSYGEGYWYKL